MVVSPLNRLRKCSSYWFLGSPYTKYPGGHEKACADVAKMAAGLIREGIPIFCPVTHSHPIAYLGGIDPVDGKLWQVVNMPFAKTAHGLIVAMLEGFDISLGLAWEISYFHAEGRPIFYVDSDLMEVL